MEEKKEKHYLSDNVQLMAEWHLTKNIDLDPKQLTVGSQKKAWWKCGNGHEWQATIKNRSNGTGCPYCSGKTVLKGYNDLQTLNPILANEWNYEKNDALTPLEVTLNSNKKVWWKCNKGHEWQAILSSRSRGAGCPYCSNKKLLIGFNDLNTTHPEIASEWHPSKNGDMKPSDVTRGSGVLVWWQCSLGHEWKTSPNKRTTSKTACPYCAGQKVLKGYNDIATTYPRLINEWHPTKNGNFTPYNVTESSARKIWWKCEKGHEWQAFPYNRIKNRNCPICSNQLSTSFPEQAIFYYIRKFFPDAENTNVSAINMELDIYIPSIKTAIEYDGVYYHKAMDVQKREIAKNQLCIENKIRLIRVREIGLCSYDECDCIMDIDSRNDRSVSDAILAVLCLLGVKMQEVDLKQDSSEILSTYLTVEHKRNLKMLNPNLAKEWHPTKNAELRPEHLAINSGKKVWWICEKGHEWQASLHNRAKGKGCPYCSGRVAISGENDLLSVHPDLVNEWHYKLNGMLQPTNVKPGSDVKVWWLCGRCGNEWRAKVSSRTTGTGCPNCSEIKKGPKRKAHEIFERELNAINPSIRLIGKYEVSTIKIECYCLVCNHKWYALPGNLLKGKGCPKCSIQKRKTIRKNN